MAEAIPYKNSELYKATRKAGLDGLLNKRPFIESALDYHRKANRLEEVAFWQKGLKHIDRRLAAFTKLRARQCAK